MIVINKSLIESAIKNIKVNFEKYLWIQNQVFNRDVRVDREFQRVFNGFYRVRRSPGWQLVFYDLFETYKHNSPGMQALLYRLYAETGMVEASFTSKLLATIDPSKPIIDSLISNHFGLKFEKGSAETRIHSICVQYDILAKEFDNFIPSRNGVHMVERFSKKFPGIKISPEKILDVLLLHLQQGKGVRYPFSSHTNPRA